MPYAGAALALLADALSQRPRGDKPATGASDGSASMSAEAGRPSAGAGAAGADAGDGDARRDSVHTALANLASTRGGEGASSGHLLRQRAVIASKRQAGQDAEPQPWCTSQTPPEGPQRTGRSRTLTYAAAAGAVLCLLAQLLAATYFCLVHQRWGLLWGPYPRRGVYTVGNAHVCHACDPMPDLGPSPLACIT